MRLAYSCTAAAGSADNARAGGMVIATMSGAAARAFACSREAFAGLPTTKRVGPTPETGEYLERRA
jgi:hypothetical protein